MGNYQQPAEGCEGNAALQNLYELKRSWIMAGVAGNVSGGAGPG